MMMHLGGLMMLPNNSDTEGLSTHFINVYEIMLHPINFYKMKVFLFTLTT